jgi:hypothetical protein
MRAARTVLKLLPVSNEMAAVYQPRPPVFASVPCNCMGRSYAVGEAGWAAIMPWQCRCITRSLRDTGIRVLRWRPSVEPNKLC